MTLPAPIQDAPTTGPDIGMLARLKLTEPVRLYLYTVLLVLTAGLQLAGWLSGDWQNFLAMNAAVILAVGGGAEAARASVYSPRSTVQAVRRAADSR